MVDGLEDLRQAASDEDLVPTAEILSVLMFSRERGRDFEAAWFNAVRAIMPPRTCGPELRADRTETLGLLREVKPHFRAAYERREPKRLELTKAERLANRRLNRLLSAEQMEIAVRSAA